MSASDWLRYEDEADERGLRLLGYYHSHPESPAIPSEYDRAHALPHFVYLITAVYAGVAAETRAWLLHSDPAALSQNCRCAVSRALVCSQGQASPRA